MIRYASYTPVWFTVRQFSSAEGTIRVHGDINVATVNLCCEHYCPCCRGVYFDRVALEFRGPQGDLQCAGS